MKKIIQQENIAEIMQTIIKVHHKHPELRFMQIIENVAGVSDLYHMQDEHLLEQLNKFYATELKK
jgi:DNA-directed RNA polymerase delta subunit